jgi:hypothetical protein
VSVVAQARPRAAGRWRIRPRPRPTELSLLALVAVALVIGAGSLGATQRFRAAVDAGKTQQQVAKDMKTSMDHVKHCTAQSGGDAAK